MNETRLYLKISKLDIKLPLEEILRMQYFDNIEIVWNHNIAHIVIYGDVATNSIKSFIPMVTSDLVSKISVLIVPKFDKVFLKYLDLIDNDVFTAFELFINNISNSQIKEDCKYLLKDIKHEYIKTVLVYLDCNMNGTQAAKELYLHRNSFNYRLNQFVYTSDMDIKNVTTLMFIKLIIEIAKS